MSLQQCAKNALKYVLEFSTPSSPDDVHQNPELKGCLQSAAVSVLEFLHFKNSDKFNPTR